MVCRNSRSQRKKTYFRMGRGIVHQTAVMGVYSRVLLAHSLAITLEAVSAKEVVQEALNRYGRLEIINADKGAGHSQSRSSFMPYCTRVPSFRWMDAVPGVRKCSFNASGARSSTNACTSRRMSRSVRLVPIIIARLSGTTASVGTPAMTVESPSRFSWLRCRQLIKNLNIMKSVGAPRIALYIVHFRAATTATLDNSAPLQSRTLTLIHRPQSVQINQAASMRNM